MILIVYICSAHGKIERYVLELYEPMPYAQKSAFTVQAFRARSRSSVLWSTVETMRAWSRSDAISPADAFCRIAEGGHPPQSPHYAGCAVAAKERIVSPFSGYGYPTLSCGDCGVHVFILQDALFTLGISPAALDGFFGTATRCALCEFQRSADLSQSGQADRKTWERLTFLAAGAGCKNKIPYLL